MKFNTDHLSHEVLDWAVTLYNDDTVESGLQAYLEAEPGAQPKKPVGYSQSLGAVEPIINEHIRCIEDLGYTWQVETQTLVTAQGRTVAEAVCRAFVKSFCGDQIDIPEEIIKTMTVFNEGAQYGFIACERDITPTPPDDPCLALLYQAGWDFGVKQGRADHWEHVEQQNYMDWRNGL